MDISSEVMKDQVNHALSLLNSGKGEAFLQTCRELVNSTPNCADAWHYLGVAEWKNGNIQAAKAHLRRAIEIDKQNPHYKNSLGVVMIETGQLQEAEKYLNQAISLTPNEADFLCNLGRAVMLQKRFNEAIDLYQHALKIDSNHAITYSNMAVAYQSCGHIHKAIECYKSALRINPKHAKWWANLGAALLSVANYTAAEPCFQNALALSSNLSTAIKGLSVTYRALDNYEKAADITREYLINNPNDEEAIASLAVIYQQTGNWDGLEDVLPRLIRQTESALAQGHVPSEPPLFNISRSDDLSLNLAVARAWSQSMTQRIRSLTPPFDHSTRTAFTKNQITIGYLSADFRNHAVAHQIVSLFELHNRRIFRVCGFSIGYNAPDDHYRKQIAGTCDYFEDIGSANAKQAAQAINTQKVDILIDLMGHTHKNRMDICALRPAPVQISYLGYLATSGADFIDYLIGDRVVTPNEHAAYYTEKLIQLPHCYQIISPIAQASRKLTRKDVGLDKDKFVFCCFNRLYKIQRPVFACWMEILKQVPQSVLWLYRTNQPAINRLRSEAAKLGVAPERLVFAGRMPLADHLSRVQLADLALDTMPYNGGSTTANVLSAGVPLVTVLGKHLLSRMSSSHLISLKLESLIALDLDSYKAIAIELAQSPEKLHTLRQNLLKAIRTSPLFDTAGFVQNLELAFQKAWCRYCEGQPPTSIRIS